jgi:hypothetical protein
MTIVARCAGVLALASVLVATVPHVSTAQRADTTCVYRTCALGLAPSLISLDVVRGADNERVARLGFFRPGNVTRAFAGSDSALHYGARAEEARGIAAIFTDIGLAAFAVAAVRATRRGEIDRAAQAWGGAGGALLAVSYPLQLRADAFLSRAVWWYNQRFAR